MPKNDVAAVASALRGLLTDDEQYTRTIELWTDARDEVEAAVQELTDRLAAADEHEARRVAHRQPLAPFVGHLRKGDRVPSPPPWASMDRTDTSKAPGFVLQFE